MVPYMLTFYFPFILFAVGVQAFVIKAFSRETSKYGRRCRNKSRCSKLSGIITTCLHAVHYPVLLYQNVFLLLYVVVDLVISSLLFSRERAKQSTHFISLESFKSLLQHFQRHSVESLTLYTLRSECIFSILFSIHFLRRRQGEFVYQSRASLVGDHFLPSCDLNV